jgi:hypothetical protein
LASKDIPDGYFWFHLGLGGLDLKSSFVPLVVIRDKIIRDPQELMQKYLKVERQGYEVAKKTSASSPANLKTKTFISFPEYVKISGAN